MLNEKQIGWLYVAIQLVLITGIIVLSINYPNWNQLDRIELRTIGLVMVVAGFILMIFIISVFFRHGQIMTPNPVPLENYSLVQTGFYRFIRHPMYSAALFTLLGVAFFYRSLPGFLLWLLTDVFFVIKINFEERKLSEKFPEYNLYRNRTKKLMPFIY